MIKKTGFKDLILIKNKCFKDSRGHFRELLRESKLKTRFPFLVMSYSKRGVILVANSLEAPVSPINSGAA